MTKSIELQFNVVKATAICDFYTNGHILMYDGETPSPFNTPREGRETIEPISYEYVKEVTQKLKDYDNSPVLYTAFCDIYGANYADIYKPEIKEKYISHYTNEWLGTSLIMTERDTYLELVEKAGAKDGDAILLNRVVQFGDDAITPYKSYKGNLTLLAPDNNDKEIYIGGSIEKDIPVEIEVLLSDVTSIQILVPEGTISGVTSAEWFIDTPDAPGIVKLFEDSVQDSKYGSFDYNAYGTDVRGEIGGIRALIKILMLFIYGFIGMLALIGLTNVISTISTNIRIRRREFAVLASTGMTKGGLRKMLAFESLFCSLKALVIGLPIGAIGYKLIYDSLYQTYKYSYDIPWGLLGMCVLAVFAITFVTTLFSASRVRKGNIIEGIRNE
jgi:putative ABC transport system permease protein